MALVTGMKVILFGCSAKHGGVIVGEGSFRGCKRIHEKHAAIEHALVFFKQGGTDRSGKFLQFQIAFCLMQLHMRAS